MPNSNGKICQITPVITAIKLTKSGCNVPCCAFVRLCVACNLPAALKSPLFSRTITIRPNIDVCVTWHNNGFSIDFSFVHIHSSANVMAFWWHVVNYNASIYILYTVQIVDSLNYSINWHAMVGGVANGKDANGFGPCLGCPAVTADYSIYGPADAGRFFGCRPCLHWPNIARYSIQTHEIIGILSQLFAT